MTGWTWWSPALAATPVVVEGPAPPGVVAEVAARTGLPEAELAVVALGDLTAARPVGVVGPGAFRRCAGAPVPRTAVDTDLARAAAARDAGDLAEAWTQLDLGVVHLGCLNEVVSAPVAARVFALRAEVRTARGEEGAPDERAAATAFEGPPTAGVPVSTLGGGSVGPWLDGRPVPATGALLAPGLHLLQHAAPGGVRSGWLTVGGPATVVFPAGVPAPLLPGLGDPARRVVVEQVLRAVVDAPAAYVRADGGLWLVELADPPRTTELTPPAAVVPEPRADSSKRRKSP